MKNIMCIICVMIMMLFTPFEVCSVDSATQTVDPDAPVASQEVLAYLNGVSGVDGLETWQRVDVLADKLDKIVRYANKIVDYGLNYQRKTGHVGKEVIGFSAKDMKLLSDMVNYAKPGGAWKDGIGGINRVLDGLQKLRPALAKFAQDHQ